MSRFAAALALCVGLGIGCGKLEVEVKIEGGDGNIVRLDADKLGFKENRLRDAGSFTFKDLRSGTYSVKVVTTAYFEHQEVQVEPPPFFGVQKSSVLFTIPASANTPFKREGTIIYASTKTNVRNWDLFAIKADDSERRQLTDTRDFEQHPVWSPDGRRILFTRGDVTTNIDVWVMDEDGGNAQRLTEHPERDERAVWSPDGQTIAFVSQREGVDVWLMDSDGGNKRKLIQGRQPSWAPDGRRIVFTSSEFDGNDELYIIDRDGGNMRRLTDNNQYDWFPSWSPDGGRLLFCSSRFGGQELFIAKGDGTGQTRITFFEKSYETEATWSPDGRGLAYVGGTQRDDRGRLLGTEDIFLVSAVGFDLDEIESPLIQPINLTNDDDRNNKSPSWRSF